MSKNIFLVGMVFLGLFCDQAAAQIYKCIGINNQTVITNYPCEFGERSIDLSSDVHPPGGYSKVDGTGEVQNYGIYTESARSGELKNNVNQHKGQLLGKNYTPGNVQLIDTRGNIVAQGYRYVPRGKSEHDKLVDLMFNAPDLRSRALAVKMLNGMDYPVSKDEHDKLVDLMFNAPDMRMRELAAARLDAIDNPDRASSSQCDSDFSCNIGYTCVKAPYSSIGKCMQAVNAYGNPRFASPNPNSILPNTGPAQCLFNSDCPVGFRCDQHYKACIK